MIHCGCSGSRHSNPKPWNCIKCGRILCHIELCKSENKCIDCGALVTIPLSSQEMEAEINDKDEKNIENILKAYQLKDKLLNFDRSYTKRTKVFDSDSDYYESAWLSPEEQEQILLKEKKRKERLKNLGRDKGFLVSMDAAGRLQLSDIKEDGLGNSDNEDYDEDHNDDSDNNNSNNNNEILQVRNEAEKLKQKELEDVRSNSLLLRKTAAGSLYRNLKERLSKKEEIKAASSNLSLSGTRGIGRGENESISQREFNDSSSIMMNLLDSELMDMIN